MKSDNADNINSMLERIETMNKNAIIIKKIYIRLNYEKASGTIFPSESDKSSFFI